MDLSPIASLTIGHPADDRGGGTEAGAVAGGRAQDVRRSARQNRRRKVGDRPPDQGAK